MHGQVPKAAKGLVVISDLDEIVKCYARRCHAICRQHIVNIVNILFIPPIHSTIHPSIHPFIHSFIVLVPRNLASRNTKLIHKTVPRFATLLSSPFPGYGYYEATRVLSCVVCESIN